MVLKLLFSAWFRGKSVHFVPICGYEELFWRIKIYSFLSTGCFDLVTQLVTLALFLLLVCALAVFIQPPSVEELRNRLVGRGTDSAEAIERRVAKAEEELTYASKFDVVLVNDNLEQALAQAEQMVAEFEAK